MKRLPVQYAFGLVMGFLMCCGPIAVLTMSSGCSTTQTQEAKAFYSFKDTWAVARTAYDRYAERVVQGKVSKDSEMRADNAWNAFRGSFRIALQAAQNDRTKIAPEDVRILAAEFLALAKDL